MFLDYTSLLLAIAFSGVALSVTLFVAWLASRGERFLVACSAAMLLMVGASGLFAIYTKYMHPMVGLASFGLTLGGTVVALGAACVFRRHKAFRRRIAWGAIGAFAPLAVAYGLGYDGMGAIIGNLVIAAFFVVTAGVYWGGRSEAPTAIATIAALYTAVGLSFAACAAYLGLESPLVLTGPLENWTEDLNVIVSIIGITGIGALSLALNQSRAAQAHRNDAMTDALTGLMNRRALFERFGDEKLPAMTAVIIFDLDEFKAVNDRYGHAVGDEALRRFSQAICDNLRPDDIAARLGGEEFALVLTRCTLKMAALMAERIRAYFEIDSIHTDIGILRCTVSAGVAITDGTTKNFTAVLRSADNALYLAKRGGRNRVASPGLHMVA